MVATSSLLHSKKSDSVITSILFFTTINFDCQKTNVRNKTKAELAEQERINDEAIIADRKARMADSMKAQNEDIIGNPNWKEVLARERKL